MFTLTWIQVKNTNHILSDVWSCKDPSFCIPLRIYGDGADAQQHFEIMTILPVLCCSSSTLDSRILCSVRNTSKTTNEARAHILQVLAWSFEALRVLDKWYYFLLFWFFQKKTLNPLNSTSPISISQCMVNSTWLRTWCSSISWSVGYAVQWSLQSGSVPKGWDKDLWWLHCMHGWYSRGRWLCSSDVWFEQYHGLETRKWYIFQF